MNNYPPLGFYFKVSFLGNDFSFQSVSGLNWEVVTESYKEGGQNEYEYELPVKKQYPNLVLKRGLWIPPPSDQNKEKDPVYWTENQMQDLQVRPVGTIYIHLKKPSEKEKNWRTWQVFNAMLKKWSLSDFNAEQNEVVIETMEFSYSKFLTI